MKKVNRIIDVKDPRDNIELLNLEGVVISSEKKRKHGRSIYVLELKIKGCDKNILIRENHRVDVGEKIRIHYSPRGDSSNNIFVEAYEILSSKGEVKHRYCEEFHKPIYD